MQRGEVIGDGGRRRGMAGMTQPGKGDSGEGALGGRGGGGIWIVLSAEKQQRSNKTSTINAFFERFSTVILVLLIVNFYYEVIMK